MERIRLAYRDTDRTPVIFCIKEMALRYYDVDVEVVRLRGQQEFESALFERRCDVIIEHLEYLFAEAANGARISFFCAPVLESGLELAVSPSVTAVDQLAGGRIAVRAQGRPHVATMRLRALGLAERAELVLVDDRDVGRWGLWKRVVAGDCVAAFMSPLYLPEAEAGGLHVLPVADIAVVGPFAQACLASFADERNVVFRNYVKAVVHALVLINHRPDQALGIALGEPMRLMGVDRRELEQRFRAMTRAINDKPYPTMTAVANGYEIALQEYPAAAVVDPLTLWDLHWIKELDDEGFIDRLVEATTL